MFEVEASYSATSRRAYGEGSSGEGRNARARRDGRQHRKHDCWFQRDGAPAVTSLKLEEAKDVQRPKRLCQISTLAVTLERRPADQLQPTSCSLGKRGTFPLIGVTMSRDHDRKSQSGE